MNNITGVDMPDTSVESGPDSTSSQIHESRHTVEVDDTEVEVEPLAHVDTQHTATRVSRTPSVSSSYQDLKLTVGGKTLTVRGNARFDHVQTLKTVHEDGRFTCKICGRVCLSKTGKLIHLRRH